MKKKAPEPPKTNRPCAVPGCPEPGEYKAPLSRWDTERYQYFCLEHVREFNAAWDYFEGWSREKIENFTHGSMVHGDRPTWSMTERIGGGSLPLFTSETLRDSFFKMMGEAPPKAARKPETKTERKMREALAVLNLEPEAPSSLVKSTYKKLVKKYHPDVNKGDKASEEIFKRITAAYTSLLKIYESAHEE